jgi:O-antigen/teichoic acid export membrane protein
MVYLARGGFWLNLGQTISSLSSLLLAIAFANLLPKEIYGNYKYVLSATGILAIPTLSGMGTAVTQAVARGYEGSLIPALKTKILWGLLGGLASLILAGYYFYQGNTTLTISFLISAVFLPFMDSFGIYDSLLLGRKLFDISTKYFIISQIIAITSLIAVLFFTKNLFLILFTYFASWTLLRFIFLKITLKNFPPNQKQDHQTISYGKHLSLMGIIGTIASYLDRLLIFHYLGAAEVAIYSIAIAPPEQIKGLFKNISILALPKFVQRTKEEIKKTVFEKIWKSVLILLIVTIVYIILAPLIFKLFFPKYPESIIFSQIFAISLVTISLIIPYSALQAQASKKELYLFNIFYYLFQIIALSIGVYFYGLMGVIIAKTLTRFFSFTLSIYLIYHKQLSFLKDNNQHMC